MELDELYPMTPWPSRSRSPFEVKVTSNKKLRGGFWPPWGNPISTKFGGHIGNDLRYRNAKGCKNRSKGSQWGWGQSFWGTLSLRHFQRNPAFCFLRYCTHICTRQFYNKIESLKRRFMQVSEIQPPKDPPFPDFSRFCQSLAQYDVPAVADTRACYMSLERTQKIEQNGTNTIFNFASLGKPRPPKVGTLKKRHFVPISRRRRIRRVWRNLTQLTWIILHIVYYYNPKVSFLIFTFLEVVGVQSFKKTQFAKKSVFCNVLASASKKPAMPHKMQLYVAIVYKLDNTHRKNKKNRSSIKRVIRYQSFKNTQLVGCTTFMKLRTLT